MISFVSLNDIAWVFSKFLFCLNTRDLGGQDLAGGLGGGRNSPPSLFSFLVENVSGSWKRGLGRQVLAETFGRGFTGVIIIGVEEDRGGPLLGGVCGELLLNILIRKCLYLSATELI